MTKEQVTSAPAIEELMAAHKETRQGRYVVTKSPFQNAYDIRVEVGANATEFIAQGATHILPDSGEPPRAELDFAALSLNSLPAVAAEMERLQKVSKSCPNCAGKIGDSGHCEECIQRDNANEARINELESSLSQLLDRAAAAEAKAEKLRSDLELAERLHSSTIDERDRAQDALQEAHIALGGDGEWVARTYHVEAPESGDLHLDVPVLAAQVVASLNLAESARQAAEQLTTEFANYNYDYLSYLVSGDDADDSWRYNPEGSSVFKLAAEYLVTKGRLEKHPTNDWYRLLPQESEVQR